MLYEMFFHMLFLHHSLTFYVCPFRSCKAIFLGVRRRATDDEETNVLSVMADT